MDKKNYNIVLKSGHVIGIAITEKEFLSGQEKIQKSNENGTITFRGGLSGFIKSEEIAAFYDAAFCVKQ